MILKMGLKNLLLLVWFVLISLGAVSAQLRCPVTPNTGFFKPNSTYERNRGLLLPSLVSNVTAHGGFYNASVGQDPDGVYAMGMCIPGVAPEVCSSCIQNAYQEIEHACPNQTEAFIWPGDQTLCLVRYSNGSFFGSLALDPIQPVCNMGNITSNMTEFDNKWKGLISRTKDAATSGTSSSKIKYYAANITALTAFTNLHALMVCTPDISPSDCDLCLQESVNYFQRHCPGKQGALVARPSCVFRWDLYEFNGAFDNIKPDEQRKSANKDSTTFSTTTVVVIVVLTIVIVSIIHVLGCILFRRMKPSYRAIELNEEDAPSSLKFELSAVKAATDDFSMENKLGEGGFGPVYKGKLPCGQDIAVKRLSIHSRQGEQEFKNEVLLLLRLQHKNLVKLLGYCFKGEERLLIYEFVPNASLDHLIFDSIKRTLATWSTRYEIIGGIARGLLYLHEDSRLRIIHRDLKPSNILLEDEMNPKISDFGLARLFASEETHAETSRIMGTYGYMAPEYATRGNFSIKSDVYSFGIMVLEIICGQKNNRFEPAGLPDHAWKSWYEGRGLDIIDPVIKNGPRREIMRCIHIGLLCVQEDVARRPTMKSVLLWLSSSSITMPLPATPSYFMQDTSKLQMSSSSQGKSASINQRQGEDSQIYSHEASIISELDPR